jgi:hypothetical protein
MSPYLYYWTLFLRFWLLVFVSFFLQSRSFCNPEMAIVKSHPGLEAQILVNGQALHEYEKEEEPEDDDTVTRYVEAQSGTEFAIWYKM